MTNRLGFFALATLSTAILAMTPSTVSAQRSIFGGNGNGNAGYNRNSRAVIVNLKNHSREFARRLDRELDRSRYNGSWGEDRLNAMAREFYQAADDLEDNWNRGRSVNRNDGDLRRVLVLGSNLDRELSRLRLSWSIQSDWSRIRDDLDMLRTVNTAYGGYDDDYRRRGNGKNDDWNRGNGNYPGNRRDRDDRNGRNSDPDRKNRYPFPF